MPITLKIFIAQSQENQIKNNIEFMPNVKLTKFRVVLICKKMSMPNVIEMGLVKPKVKLHDFKKIFSYVLNILVHPKVE